MKNNGNILITGKHPGLWREGGAIFLFFFTVFNKNMLLFFYLMNDTTAYQESISGGAFLMYQIK